MAKVQGGSPVQVGDVIVSVDNIPVQVLIDSLYPLMQGGNPEARLKFTCFYMLRGDNLTYVNLGV